MSLRNIQIESEYRNLHGNIIRDFYNPLLSEAIAYDRSVGFFSSTALSCFSVGLCSFLKNGGKIRLVATPYLSTEDIQAMRDGYKARNEIIENALVRNLFEPENGKEVERLNMLANLIAECRMDIKIALTKAGMYHEKLGIIEDSDGNYVAFSGSSNESENAFLNNYESTDVFCSWKDFEKDRALKKKNSFEKIWNGTDDALEILEFPKLKDEIIRRYKKTAPKFDMDEDFSYEPPKIGEMNLGESSAKYSPLVKKNVPMMPKWFEKNIFDYQKEAIDNWAKQGFCGIFDMATGTGKTLTGLGAVTRCFESNKKLATFIVVPYQHLVEQWVEDVVKFNIRPIIAYSTSSQIDWKDRLKKAVRDQKIRPSEKSFFCVVTTNATFKSNFVQDQLKNIKADCLLVVDEAHNAGAGGFKKILDSKFNYRLALSATIDRHGDDEGTRFLYDYFGYVCVSYGLEKAIEEKKLTPYKYYPIIIHLTDGEFSEYKRLTKEMLQHTRVSKSGNVELDSYGELLAIKRSRIVAGAQNKLDAFRKCIEPYKKKTNILVYCGATTVVYDSDSSGGEYDFDKSEVGERQIIAVTKILGNEMGMSVSRFTSEEDIASRRVITENFKNENLQAIVAIKCLDEGVNIPSIKTAFILASTTNPKEYIQRRGRVLRTWPGKEYAEIYDFVTLPQNIDAVRYLTDEEKASGRALVKNELLRLKEFSGIALNRIDSLCLIDEIQQVYQITDKDLNDKKMEDFYE
ncbi:helicase domain protein [Fibrobacter succinogenes subsp. succinogenes S85]|uniref:Helicase domain protein n=1 Tax=Fibrobacter succinogenes (strain ATCC 19169 / S85) TaxID=59374 RepID=C9RRS8_FIBSS|nr:DEAD/DEAH box helicase family protein [Fibrobacter succinogenes]ACX75264.1 type III restriction protein res subunit [Fibrobacter succinogenes subsp. succinogenes S85]ADL25118.1 helicase domain protein [Fibrobacter succinogenes subsp. succinogenes S85]